MKTKITYLMGAGASANCLPTVKHFSQRLTLFRTHLNNELNRSGVREETIASEHHNTARLLISDLDWLIFESKKHKTIDTLAKKFYLNSMFHKELVKLKTIIITFFLFEQTIGTKYPISTPSNIEHKEKVDSRYDSFIAAMIENKIDRFKLPDNLKIISWNYDIQFELALTEYYTQKNIKQIQNIIQAHPSCNLNSENYTWDKNKFTIVRLNGIAGIGSFKDSTETENPTFFDGVIKNPNGSNLNDILLYYSEITANGSDPSLGLNDLSSFLFSWEQNDDFGQFIHPYYKTCKEVAKKIMEETEILVVIGYSFPIFNREVDFEIINAAKNLKKIYVQDTNSEEIVDLLSSSFEKIQSVDDIKNRPELQYHQYIPATYVKNCSQFLIPYELI